jgi:hypothetical protein
MLMAQDLICLAMELAYFRGLNAGEAVAGGVDGFMQTFENTEEGEATHVAIGQSRHWIR